MNRLCKVGDVIKSNKFIIWRPGNDGSFHLSSGPTSNGNDWLVIRTQSNGGGTGHGPHDVYPDGHEVTIQMIHSIAEGPSSDLTLKFYQTGCFTNMIEPKDIELVKALKYELRYSWQES